MNEKGYDPRNNMPSPKNVGAESRVSTTGDTVDFVPDNEEAERIRAILETLPQKGNTSLGLTNSNDKGERVEEGSEWRLTA